MGPKVTFELDEQDLSEFQELFRSARGASQNVARDEVLAATSRLLDEVRAAQVPRFVLIRIEYLEVLVAMVTDEEWNLPAEEIDRILDALIYFANPEDVIPDKVPGVGYLDDAIMVEIVRRELEPEIQAYTDFCEFRRREEQRRRQAGTDTKVSREDWLHAKREELHSRMRKRRRWRLPLGKRG